MSRSNSSDSRRTSSCSSFLLFDTPTDRENPIVEETAEKMSVGPSVR